MSTLDYLAEDRLSRLKSRERRHWSSASHAVGMSSQGTMRSNMLQIGSSRSLWRYSCPMMDGIHILDRVHQRGALVKVLDKPHLDLTTPFGKGLLALLSALAEDERHRIVSGPMEGRAIARKNGARFGRKPKLTEHQQKEGRRRLAKGESARQIARDFNVQHATVSRLR